jgi:hypothetical protein
LWDSAGKAVNQRGELLWKEGHLEKSTTVRFQRGEVRPEALDANEAQSGEMGVHGPSADLMFALAFATRVIPKAYPAIAATGELGTDADTGWVLPVRGVPAKIEAALPVLPPGGLLFFPKANEPEILS